MAIALFRRPYTIRRHDGQKIVNGYAAAAFTDFTTRLNVQPLSVNELLALPEGERTVKRVKSFGADALITADVQSGRKSDLLYYDGAWYDCKTCVHWLHTPLTHYESEFVILADQTAQAAPNGGG